MTTPNDAVLGPCFAYEATAGTAIITAADTATYLFGKYGAGYKPDLGGPEWNVDQAMAYNARQASAQAISGGNFSPFTLRYSPVNAQPFYRLFGTGTDASPDTITVKNSGLKKSFTLRHESKGGTNPLRSQWVGCFTTGLHIVAEADKFMQVDETINYWSFEDQDDRVALTTAPIFPESIATPYFGINSFTYGGNAKTYITRVQLSLEQEVSESAHAATSQTLYPGSFKPHALTVLGVSDDASIWDDWKHNTISTDAVLKVTKEADTSKYVQFNLNNIAWKRVIISPKQNLLAGFYLMMAVGQPQTVDIAFTHEGSNFATHFP
jgi:hypothetical protein